MLKILLLFLAAQMIKEMTSLFFMSDSNIIQQCQGNEHRLK